MFKNARKIDLLKLIARRTERKNQNVLKVHEDFEYRVTRQAV